MLKIAYCLYGQPRNFENGYNVISKFTENYNVDFYYHTWTLNDENERYSNSHYRKVDISELLYDKDIINKLNALYKPKGYISDVSREFAYENKEEFNNSLMIKNTLAKHPHLFKLNRISNTFSNFYSKQRVRDLLNETIERESINYDLVIISRFDMLKDININLNLLDKNKVYVANMHRPRYIISDHMLIMNVENFLKTINVYNNLKNILNNKNVNDLVRSFNEELVFVAEGIIFANYLYYFQNLDNVEYINIPDFH